MKKIVKLLLPFILSVVLAASYPAAVFASGEEGGYEEEYAGDEYSEDEGSGDEYSEGEYSEGEGGDEYSEGEGSADENPQDEAGEDVAEDPDAEGSEETGDGEEESTHEGEGEPDIEINESGWPVPPEVVSGSVMMIEVNTGAVMYEKDIDVKRFPASTTKILTCLIALERCSMNERVTFSANAVDLEKGDSSIDAVEGEQMSLKDCLYGLMLPSGNDCATAIAEHVGGSVEGFAELMNKRAEEIGCTGSHFTNPHGLYDPDHYTTAEDLCKIAQVAFNNSAFVEIVSHATYTIPTTNKSEARSIENTNYMIIPNSNYYNDTVVGGKTGYLPESGRCLVTLAEHGGMTVIVVCMFSSLYNGVFTDTQELLDYSFHGFAMNNISETESRFKFASQDAKVVLDSTSQILMPASIPVNSLDSEIEFTYDLDIDEFQEASKNAGITSRDGRHLYATINYSYGGNYLGHINVLINDNLEAFEPSFAEVKYVSPMWFAAAAAAVILITILLFAIIRHSRPKNKRRRGAAARRRRA